MTTSPAPLVGFTVDVEPDCPPYLTTCRGIEEGLGRLLALLREEAIRGTFFVTGTLALSHAAAIEAICRQGHELGSHGMNHLDFTKLDEGAAAAEIGLSRKVLLPYGPVTSFRAPYLRFPDRHLPLLAAAGFTLDSSEAKYKPAHYRQRAAAPLTRIPVSMTSSVLRLPFWLRSPLLAALSSPIVLFVHPWEFVDLTKERLRLDCRFRTGLPALACLKSAIAFFRARGARFGTLRELAKVPEKS